MNWKPDADKFDMGVWVICHAIGKDREKFVNSRIRNEDGSYPITLTVGGVELDFANVAKAINNILIGEVSKRVQSVLDNKYQDIVDEISEIQDRISNQKERFRYDYEEVFKQQ